MQAFLANVEWAGTAFIPVAWLLFGLEYTGRDATSPIGRP
jgi:hypothetical protein